ncbi:GNAT family N-acetyltransferase [Actinomadura sp. HBU206391]|uniref:GNAT family N-acetyltransferase n=1 Tax=Actinomadura sp. HBU206391 TaxID=2731692 RepID=UPI0016500619|nr:GNAT family N-acetyltransferase [Actinomadura sp. HBU206391]MBC6461785.1 GNAT family N-acetyltransferase [Actinomadura sp. HBU206391]
MSDSGDSGRCGRRRHRLQQGPILLRTAGIEDMVVGHAAASDPEAQYWLGWRPEQICPAPVRAQCLETIPREDRAAGRGKAGSHGFFAALDPGSGRLLGMVGINLAQDRERYEMGGWLAPDFRGRGLGAALFQAAVRLAHEHLGIVEVAAGTEQTNIASQRSLIAAGFVSGDGPDPHILPNGRVIASRWFRHGSAAHLCRKGGVREWLRTP